MVVGLLFATVPAVRAWINPKVVAGRQWVESKIFTQYAPVRAVKATATPVDKKHPAIAAVDGFTNTYWSTPVTGTRRIAAAVPGTGGPQEGADPWRHRR